MKKILLDTNAYSALLKGSNEVFKCVAQANTVYLSLFVIGELLAGFKCGSKEAANKMLLYKFLEKPTVEILHTTLDTAEHFADIKLFLKKAGTPIPINDVWIAAHARESGSEVVTFNAHFSLISGLAIRHII